MASSTWLRCISLSGAHRDEEAGDHGEQGAWCGEDEALGKRVSAGAPLASMRELKKLDITPAPTAPPTLRVLAIISLAPPVWWEGCARDEIRHRGEGENQTSAQSQSG